MPDLVIFSYMPAGNRCNTYFTNLLLHLAAKGNIRRPQYGTCGYLQIFGNKSGIVMVFMAMGKQQGVRKLLQQCFPNMPGRCQIRLDLLAQTVHQNPFAIHFQQYTCICRSFDFHVVYTPSFARRICSASEQPFSTV